MTGLGRIRNCKGFILPVMLAVAVASYLLLTGCSNARHHKTLAFFFDGVPDPADSARHSSDTLAKPSKFSGANRPPRRDEVQTLVVHPPYKQQKCATCHEMAATGQAHKKQPELCYGCHADFGKKFPTLHGPVASGYCTACHNPHMSQNKMLLQRAGRALCLNCHEEAPLLLMPVHRESVSAICTECHDPHGGDGLNLLKKAERK